MAFLRSRLRPKKRKLLELELESLEDRIMLSTVELFAAGSDGGEQMQLQIDGTTVDSWNVTAGADTGQFQTYQYNTPDTVTADQVRIAFTNDAADDVNSFNLRVDAIAIDGVRFETEDATVYSTGTWLPADGTLPGFRQSEYLHTNGYFQFGVDPTGPVAHWMLEETAIGQTVVDSSGLGNDGTHVNISLPEGPSGNAVIGNSSLSTDGVDDYVSIAADPSLDLSGGSFTQSIWILPEHTDNGYHGVLGFQGDDYLQRYAGIWVTGQDRIHAGFGDGTEFRSFTTDSVLTPFAWNHVVTTFDGNEYKVYVDGAEAFSTLALAGATPYATQQVNIGRIDNRFDGLIDDVQIYQRALDASEVGQLFNTGVSTLTVSIAAASIGEADGAAATTATVTRNGDLSGALVVALASSDSSEASVPSSVTIADNQASATFNIDAVDDAVFDGTQTVTIAASAAGFLGGTETINVTDDDSTTGPVGHWMLEETAIGQTVVDSSGLGNDGTHVNIAAPEGPNANAVIGNSSLSTDGVDDYVSIAADPSLDLSGGQFTQSIWILPEHTDNGYHGVLGYHDDGYLQRYPGIWVQDQDRIHAGFGDGTEFHSLSTGSVLTPFDWNHVVTTFDGDEYKVYVNGSEVFSTFGLSGQTPFATQQVNIGRIDNNFDGLIDEVQIYQRALDASEVSQLYDSTVSTLTVTIATASIGEADGAAATTATVTRNGDLSGALVVALASSDSSEASVPSSVTIADNQASATFNIDAVDDAVFDGTQTVTIAASAAGFLGGTETINVTDDDSTTGPVGHWMLEETAIGQTVVDSSGLGNDGTHVNISLPEGPSGNAVIGNSSLSTDGVDDYVSIAADPSLDLSGGQFTQSIWILPEHTDNGYHGVLGYHDDGYLQRYPGIWVQDQDRIHAGFGDGTEFHSLSTGSVLTPFDWNHVVTTFDGDEYKVYVDGAEVFSTLALAGATPYATQQVNIGRIDNNFDGLIDEVQIYQRALDASEVGDLFDAGASDPGTLQLAETSYVVNESDGTVSIEVVRVGGSAGTLSANYATADGTATAPADYTSTSGVVTFLDGETSQIVEIPITEDSEGELLETFTFSLDATDTADVTILDNDPRPGTISWTLDTMTTGEDVGTLNIVLFREAGSDGTVTIDYTTIDGTADSSDYQPISGTLTFDDGVTVQQLSIAIVDDQLDEVDETFSIELSNPTGGASLGPITSKVVTIADNDEPPVGTLQLAETSYVVNESDGTVSVEVVRVGGSSGTVTAGYATADGSATAPADYTSTSGTLTFSDGQTSQIIAIPITDDAAHETDESFTLSLDSSDSAEVSIIDDDPQSGAIGLTLDSLTIDEDLGTLNVVVFRANGSDGTVTIDYTTVDGTADGSDYQPISGTLTFGDGVTGQQLSIAIADDELVEDDETFSIELSNPTGGATLGLTTSQVVTITDNDEPFVGVIFEDSFESVSNWTTNPSGTDTATTGQWEIGSPQSTSSGGATMQFGSGHTGPGALVTGLAAGSSVGSYDIDSGATSVLSPEIAIPDGAETEVSFEYNFAYLSNASNDDYFRVAIVSGGVETEVYSDHAHNSVQAANWQDVALDISQFAGQTIQILFEAADAAGGSLIEASVDDVVVEILPNLPGTISIATTGVNIDESAGTATVTIARNVGRLGQVTVDYSTVVGTADLSDFTPASGTLVFADGQAEQTVVIDILDDVIEEDLESFQLVISNPTGGAILGSEVSASVTIADNDSTVPDYLPDLTPIASTLTEALSIDTSEIPGRTLLRFSTEVANAGDGPLELWGGSVSGDVQQVFQRIYQADGGFRDALAGEFVYHAGHGHIHFEGFATYNLRIVDGNGNIVASGGKTSFCLINIRQPFPDVTADAGLVHGRGGNSCGQVQGISAGYSDVYSASLDDQWIDVTDVSDGTYWLEITTDPDDSIQETDETNNTARVQVTLANGQVSF